MTAPRQRYPIPGGRTRVEDEIKGSRFITTIAHAPTVVAARSFMDSVRAEYTDATHNCWAYIVGPPGSTRNIGASDDGEPVGTAGRPMLRVLLGADVGDVAVVVTRYFGGVKLGRGGLARAYAGGVQHALREMSRAERKVIMRGHIWIPYAVVDAVRRLLPRYEARIDEENFGADAQLLVHVPQEHLDDFERDVQDVCSGSARIEFECDDTDTVD